MAGTACFAQAPTLSPGEKYSRYFFNSNISEKSIKIARYAGTKVCSVSGCAFETTAQAAQVIFLVATVAAIEGVKQQSEIASLKKQSTSIGEKLAIAGESAKNVVASTEFWGGVGSMLATNAVANPAIQTFHALIQNSSTNPLLQKLLTNSVANLIGFVGFEIGSELVKWAIEMMNPEDQKEAHLLIPKFWKLLMNPKAASANELKIVTKIFENIIRIFSEDELRETWWSYVTRNRIQTGEFATGVALMSLGGTIGNAAANCFPKTLGTKVGGIAVGMTVGIGAGVVAGFIPKEYKDALTSKAQNSRIKFAYTQSETAQTEIQDLIVRYNRNLQRNQILNDKSSPLKEDWKAVAIRANLIENLEKIEKATDNLMTAGFDQIYMLNAQLLSTTNKIYLAQDSGNIEAESELRKYFYKIKAAYTEARVNIEEKLTQQNKNLKSLAEKTKTPELTAQLQGQLKRSLEVQEYSKQFLNQLQTTSHWSQLDGPQKEIGTMTEEENQEMLGKMYMWGFKREPFVQYIQYN